MRLMSRKKLSEDYKLPARSAPEIVGAFGRLLNDLKIERKILFNGRKLTGEALVSAVLLDFLAKTPEEQRRILAQRVAEFEQLMASDDPPPIVGMGRRKPLTGPPIVIDRRVDEDPELPPSPGRKRKPR